MEFIREMESQGVDGNGVRKNWGGMKLSSDSMFVRYVLLTNKVQMLLKYAKQREVS